MFLVPEVIEADDLCESCLFCGEFIENHAVVWRHSGGVDLHLHPYCCVPLTIKLLQDFHQLQDQLREQDDLLRSLQAQED